MNSTSGRFYTDEEIKRIKAKVLYDLADLVEVRDNTLLNFFTKRSGISSLEIEQCAYDSYGLTRDDLKL